MCVQTYNAQFQWAKDLDKHFIEGPKVLKFINHLGNVNSYTMIVVRLFAHIASLTSYVSGGVALWEENLPSLPEKIMLISTSTAYLQSRPRKSWNLGWSCWGSRMWKKWCMPPKNAAAPMQRSRGLPPRGGGKKWRERKNQHGDLYLCPCGFCLKLADGPRGQVGGPRYSEGAGTAEREIHGRQKP